MVAVSAATLLETHLVLTNRIGKDTLPWSMHLCSGPKLKSFRAAAFIRFCKGRHKAALNFVDCINSRCVLKSSTSSKLTSLCPKSPPDAKAILTHCWTA